MKTAKSVTHAHPYALCIAIRRALERDGTLSTISLAAPSRAYPGTKYGNFKCGRWGGVGRGRGGGE